MQTQFRIVAHMARVQSLEGPESVRRKRRHPFSERGSGLLERGDGFAELAAVHVVSVRDVQWEQAERELPAQLGWVGRVLFTRGWHGAVGHGRCESEHSSRGNGVRVCVEFPDRRDLVV